MIMWIMDYAHSFAVSDQKCISWSCLAHPVAADIVEVTCWGPASWWHLLLVSVLFPTRKCHLQTTVRREDIRLPHTESCKASDLQ